MCNKSLLQQKIEQSGLKAKFIAEKCGMSYQTFLNKMNNLPGSEFKATEMMTIKMLLHLTDEEFNAIFFAEKVE